jgi:hypothetical protein
MSFVVIVILGIVIGMTYLLVSQNNHMNKSKELFENLTNFECSDKYISKTFGTSIAYDSSRRKICFLTNNETKIYEYKDIIQSELDIDGETVLKQSLSGTIGRSVIGGVLGGGVGAIIGGTTGSKKGKENIKSIELKITINDATNPICRVNFMNVEAKKGGLTYELNYIDAEQWHGIITVLIKKNEIEQNESKQQILNSNSVADELLKLKKLLDSQVINKIEFNLEKKKLLKIK